MELISKFASKFNLRCYSEGGGGADAAMEALMRDGGTVHLWFTSG